MLMSESNADLLARWLAGEASEYDLFDELREPMTESASRGIFRIIKQRPNRDDTNLAVGDSFDELFSKGPEAVKTSLRGLAKTIAYRNGMDVGRTIIKRATDDRSLIEAAERGMFEPPDEADELEREAMHRRVAECMKRLTEGQAKLIKAKHFEQVGLKEFADQSPVSYESTRRQYNRGMASLQRCMEVHV